MATTPPNIRDNAVIEAIKILSQNVQNDNSVINAKLTQYIAVQSLLVVALEKTSWKEWFIAILGLLTSACWFFSMLRTQQYRARWMRRANRLVDDNPAFLSPAFDLWRPRDLPWWGGLSSVIVQISLPVIGFLAWLYKLVPKP